MIPKTTPTTLMGAIFLLFWRICLLQQGPERVPGQISFLVAVLVADLVVSVAITLLISDQLTALQAITAIVVTQCVCAAVVYFALDVRDLEARFTTALAAIFGCDLLITSLQGAALALAQSTGAAAIAQLAFALWALAVTGFILHRALDVYMFIGVLLAVAIALFAFVIGQMAIAS